MQHIIEGFLSFQKEIFPQRKELFRSLASSQNPKALFISCSDSVWSQNWSLSKSQDNSLSFVMLATSCHRSALSQAVSPQRLNTRLSRWA